jgi:hypothetical protein
MTDKFTDGYLRLVFQTFTDNCTDSINPSVFHNITDGINPSVYFKRELFFGVQFPSVKPSAIFFVLPTDIATDDGITDERNANGRISSMKTLVN